MCLSVAGLALLCVGCASKPEIPPVKEPTPTIDVNPVPKAVEHLGGIEILGSSPTKVLVDGKPAGTTPVTVENLRVGTYEVTYIDEVGGNATHSVVVAEGMYPTVTHNRIPKAGEAVYPDKK